MLGKDYKSWSSSLCSFLHSPVTSSLCGPSILPSTLFSNTLSSCSSLNVRDEVSHPYRTTGKIIILQIQFLSSLERDEKKEGSGLNGGKLYQNSVSFEVIKKFEAYMKC
jgi:hypothetical protein